MDKNLSNKINELFGKVDNKILAAKLNSALQTLKTSDPEELSKKINKTDKNEIMKKLNELDENGMQELSKNFGNIKNNVSETDLRKLEKALGNDSDEIMKKIHEFLDT